MKNTTDQIKPGKTAKTTRQAAKEIFLNTKWGKIDKTWKKKLTNTSISPVKEKESLRYWWWWWRWRMMKENEIRMIGNGGKRRWERGSTSFMQVWFWFVLVVLGQIIWITIGFFWFTGFWIENIVVLCEKLRLWPQSLATLCRWLSKASCLHVLSFPPI